MSEWQPIETAPKDGTPILLCEDGIVFEGQFEVDADNWYAANISSSDYYGRAHYPSHWMPLPAAPSDIGRY